MLANKNVMLLINTLAPAPDMPVVRVRLAAENMRNVVVLLLIHGHGRMVLALALQNINTLARAPDIPAAPVRLAAESIQNVNVRVDTLGAVENVRNSHLQAHHPAEG